ncbi:hypothetical protein PV733_38420 [Streptomyces europaeiscabiei]|uniref:hypothetical protein n=1 Tax=Streptomyces europaeiscabiei TaxID=146819 RepID=UPI0029A6730B|nr:hypothetical protein [Streptomyces europaeiscabiei]MDX3714705.1 hypothetical protein [Streptomyces europaeiscabiei]
MSTLPRKYRIPTSMIWYTIFAAAVFSGMLYLFVRDMGLSGSTMTGITIAGPAIILIVVVRILRLGTVVAADGVTRRGFLVDRHHPWSDVYEFEVVDRQVVNVAYGSKSLRATW